jgi:hypothetical protein
VFGLGCLAGVLKCGLRGRAALGRFLGGTKYSREGEVGLVVGRLEGDGCP